MPDYARSHLGVQTLLQQIQDKFQTMSDQIFGRIDDMSILIDNLEGNLTNFLMKEQKFLEHGNLTPCTLVSWAI
uniref:Heat shock factor-binding protein 1 n=1 Tax=Canis lupus familiaris TaxID=9615 RepID=A0A8C0NJA7_CANLF